MALKLGMAHQPGAAKIEYKVREKFKLVDCENISAK